MSAGIIFPGQTPATTTTPASGAVTLFSNSSDSNKLYYKDSTGTSYPFASTFSTISNSSIVNVKDYGAIGNGTADDTTSIQNAINALQPGGIVFFPTGTYKVSSTLTCTTFHIQFLGASKTDCVIKTNSATANILEFNSWYCGAEALTFDSSVTRTAGYAVKFTDGNNRHYLKNCEIDNMVNGVLMSSHLSFLDDVEFRTFQNGGSWVEVNCSTSSAHDQYIRRITGDNGAANKNAANTAGIKVIQCASLVMESCNLVNGGALGAMYLNPGASQVIPSVYISNTFFDQSGYGLRMDGNATGTIQRIKCEQCWFATHTNDGVFLNSSNSVGIQGLDFLNCDFYQNVNGINANAGYQDWTVRGSRFSGNTTTGIRTTAVSTGSFTIADNFIGNGSGFGANALGINIQSGTYGGYQVLDNRGLDSNTTAGITDAGVVGTTAFKNVKNNTGALIQGVLPVLTSGGAAVTTARGAVTSGTGETLLFTSRIPANSVAVGQTFRVTLYGQSSSTGTLQFRVRVGAAGTVAGDTQIWIPTITAGQVTNAYATVECLITVAALGPTATVAGAGKIQAQAVVFGTVTGAEVVANVPTTAPWFIDVTCACSVGTFTVREGMIEAL